MSNNFEKRFRHHLLQRCGVNEQLRILVGLSGGADSVALLHLLKAAGHTTIAAHCNFNLRGSESDADEAFVRGLCRKEGIEVHVQSFDTTAYARSHKLSIEMAARELRYRWFQQLMAQHNCALLATGHHGNDAIETFFLNLSRGTGVRGLTGMDYRREQLIRPLLFASADEIRNFCKERALSWREDATNSETLFVRNKIRHRIQPLFEELNPSFFATMQHNLDHLRELAAFFDTEMEKLRNEWVAQEGDTHLIPLRLLREHPQKNSVLFELLRPYGFNSKVAQQIAEGLDSEPGRQFFSATHRLVIDRYNLLLVKDQENDQNRYILEGGCKQLTVPLSLKWASYPKTEAFILSKNPHEVQLDAELIDFPLYLRKARPGDRFIPLGMTGFKKISDFYVDQKLSLLQKEDTWLLTNGHDILWVVGHRIDERYKITPSTRTILHLTLT